MTQGASEFAFHGRGHTVEKPTLFVVHPQIPSWTCGSSAGEVFMNLWRLVQFLQPTTLHLALELLPSRGRVLRDAVIAEQTLDPQPVRPMLARGQVPRKVPPRIREQPILWRQQPRPNRI